MRAGLLGKNVSGKIFVADGRIDERRRVCENAGETERTGSAALLIGIGLRSMPIAIMAGRFHFHLGAAIGLLNFRNERLPRDRGEGERSTEDQTEQDSENPSHRRTLYHAP